MQISSANIASLSEMNVNHKNKNILEAIIIEIWATYSQKPSQLRLEFLHILLTQVIPCLFKTILQLMFYQFPRYFQEVLLLSHLVEVRIGQSHGNRAGSFARTHVVDAGLVALETLNTF
jgi:hypothetical protein